MKVSRHFVLFGTVALLAVVGIGTSSAQVKQGTSRPLQTKNLMKGVVAANCGALKKELEAGPADDKAWATVVMQAELLNESGHILMADGRCPDADWANAAQALRDGSEKVLAMAHAKDVAGATEAFQAMTMSCGACHKAHKK